MQYDYQCYTHTTPLLCSVGKNLFLLQGRIMLGVHWQHLAASACMIIITWLLYVAMVVPFLHEQQLYSVSISLCTINLTLLLCTATCDPGILPRRRSQLHEAVQSETYLLKTQFCRICNIVRPSRARHCKFCDNCVDIFDHHCPVSECSAPTIPYWLAGWLDTDEMNMYMDEMRMCMDGMSMYMDEIRMLDNPSFSTDCGYFAQQITISQWTGTCIGVRNYPPFICFVVSVFLGAAMVCFGATKLFVGLIIGLPSDQPGLRMLSLLLVLPWSLLVLFMVGMLLCFHLYLIFSQMSTNEYFRDKRIKMGQQLTQTGSTNLQNSISSESTPVARSGDDALDRKATVSSLHSVPSPRSLNNAVLMGDSISLLMQRTSLYELDMSPLSPTQHHSPKAQLPTVTTDGDTKKPSDTEVFVSRRCSSSSAALLWCFPCGYIDQYCSRSSMMMSSCGAFHRWSCTSSPLAASTNHYTYRYLCLCIPLIPRTRLLPLWQLEDDWDIVEEEARDEALLKELHSQLLLVAKWFDEQAV